MSLLPRILGGNETAHLTERVEPPLLVQRGRICPGAASERAGTALEYVFININPDRIHLTVPAARRVRRSGGDLYVIHRQDLAAEQVGWWQQIPTATLPTAMAQCTAAGVPGYLLRQALTAGRARGELSAADVDALERALEARDARR